MTFRSTAVLTFAVATLGAVTIGTHSAAAQVVRPVVQVRDVPTAPIVEILAWNAAEPSFGLRSWVRRGGSADRYHRFWVAKDVVPSSGDISSAQSLNRPLQTSLAGDTQNCLNGVCTPSQTFGARFLDNVIRSSKEDLPVKFFTGGGSDYTFTLRRPVVEAYLAAVDSVVAAQKK